MTNRFFHYSQKNDDTHAQIPDHSTSNTQTSTSYVDAKIILTPYKRRHHPPPYKTLYAGHLT